MDHNENPPMAGRSTRRDFIKKATTAAAVVSSINAFNTPVYGQTQAPSANVNGANDRISIGYIGIGGKPSNCPGMGLGHIGMQKKAAAELNIRQAAVCDLWEVRNDIAKKTIETSDVSSYTDYRSILDRKDIDAVLIATHDVWHARCSIEAMDAGKHVYCEKPVTRYLGEVFDVYDTVKRTKKVYQGGSQGTSAEGWHKAAEIIKSGKLGKLVWARGAYLRNNPAGEWNYSMIDGADAIDWNKWLGPVKVRPSQFNPDHFFRWRKFYPYCGGLLGDLVPHRLYPLMLATGSPEFPKRVVCIGTHNIHSDKNTQGAEMRDVPEYVQITAEFPSGFVLSINSSSVSGSAPGFTIYGHDGTMNLADPGNEISFTPERHKSEEVDSISLRALGKEDQVVHTRNWLDCIRTGAVPNCNIDLAVKGQTVISLAEMSDRLGIACFFDEKTRKVTDRSGKVIPAITYGTLERS